MLAEAEYLMSSGTVEEAQKSNKTHSLFQRCSIFKENVICLPHPVVNRIIYLTPLRVVNNLAKRGRPRKKDSPLRRYWRKAKRRQKEKKKDG